MMSTAWKRFRTLSAGLLCSLALAAPANAAQYDIDLSHAFIQFRIFHLGYSVLTGRFNQFGGTFEWDKDNPSASSIEVTVDTNSIDSNWAERDKHLRGEDFLNVEKFPKASFKSTKYMGDAKGGKLEGVLTLHGVSKLLETIELVSKRINANLKLGGVMLCLYETATKLAKEVDRDVQDFLEAARGQNRPWSDAHLFETRIRKNIRLAEAPSFGKSIFEYAPDSPGAFDYDALAEEYLASGGWEGKAGAFGYQDRLGWVHIIEGSESNVVGLPMELLAEMLEELGARGEERGAGSQNKQ